jgi:hypothetical protein
MLFAFMSLPRRILTTVAITLGVIALGAFYVAPVALSFDAARKAPPAARVVPTELKDLSVSQVQGTKLLYVGYEFEIPWNDLDPSQTRSVPKDHPEMVALVFRSGLHLIVSASPPRMLPNESPGNGSSRRRSSNRSLDAEHHSRTIAFLKICTSLLRKRCTAGDSARVCTTANRCCSC